MKKLKNKCSGEIVTPLTMYYDATNEKYCINYLKDDGYDAVAYYDSIFDIWEHWEVVDIKSCHYFCSNSGKIHEEQDDNPSVNYEDRKLIGNNFKTKADCEHAVEKLKAFKRLRQKGLVFCGWSIAKGKIDFIIDEHQVAQDGIVFDDVIRDMELLFSGNDRKAKTADVKVKGEQ